MHLPQGQRFFSGPNLQGKVISACASPGRECTPKAEQESNFEEIGEMWSVGKVIWVVLACFLRATTKKVNFLAKKSAPHTKYWLHL